MPTVTASPTIVSTTPNSGTLTITNPSNVVSANGVFASVSSVAPDHEFTPVISHAILATGFDFSTVPDSATLTGITYEGKVQASELEIVYSVIYMIENGVLTHGFTVQPNWTETLAYESSTLVTSLPSVAVLKASNFGLAMQIGFFGGDGVTSIDALVDHIRCTATYSEAVVSLSPTLFASLPSNKGHLSIPLNKSHLTMPENKGHLTIPNQ